MVIWVFNFSHFSIQVVSGLALSQLCLSPTLGSMDVRWRAHYGGTVLLIRNTGPTFPPPIQCWEAAEFVLM